MIRIKVSLHDGSITELEVKGHAGFAESGHDLVCAGVSCIMYGTYNALVELSSDGFSYKLDEGYFRINTSKTDCITQTILKTALIQLETMHTSYADYIKLKKTEV